MPGRDGTGLRPSGYASRFFEVGYGSLGALYDPIVWMGFAPFGGERRCRETFVRWARIEPGQHVASLCSGTGSTELALLRLVPDARVVGVDLSERQLSRARRKVPSGRVTYLCADASATGLPSGSFDRVLIVMALHEMPRGKRVDVLREARRLCRPSGLVTAIEHGAPERALSRVAQQLCWFLWVPGNPEARTSRDLVRHGLDKEMEQAGLSVVERHHTRPAWIQGIVARPFGPLDPSAALGVPA